MSLGRDKSTPVRLQQPHSAETQHTGLLLVALPSLLDPSFRRTILFLTHHDQEGAMGFILNRPMHESLGELAESPMDLAAVPVFEGGPVERQNLIRVLAGVHHRLEHLLGDAAVDGLVGQQIQQAAERRRRHRAVRDAAARANYRGWHQALEDGHEGTWIDVLSAVAGTG